MQYFTRHLVARVPMEYFAQRLQPGDEFHATHVDGDYFVKHGRARDAAATSAPVAAAPPAETAASVEPTEDILDLSIAKITPQLAGFDVDQLQALRAREEDGKARQGLMVAIGAEIASRSAAQ
jgi:hypothetical protein